MGRKQKILVVDDEKDMCEIVSTVCEHAGFEAIEALNGLEAIDILSKESVDVVISDVMMPKMTGLQLLKHIRNEDQDIPFIVMTGYSSQELALDSLIHGAFDLIHKPFEMTYLNQIVKEAFRVSGELKRTPGKKAGVHRQLDDNDISVIEAKAKQEIAKIKALSQQGEPLAVDDDSGEGRVAGEFKREAQRKLKEAEKAVLAISNESEDSEWELGFLFRVYQSIARLAKTLKYKEIEQLASVLETCFANFRVRPRLLSGDRLLDLRHSNQVLQLLVSNVPELPSAELKKLAENLSSKVNISTFYNAN